MVNAEYFIWLKDADKFILKYLGKKGGGKKWDFLVDIRNVIVH